MRGANELPTVAQVTRYGVSDRRLVFCKKHELFHPEVESCTYCAPVLLQDTLPRVDVLGTGDGVASGSCSCKARPGVWQWCPSGTACSCGNVAP